MQIDYLRTFLTVAQLGGFHAAADKLNLTQAAVSARIRTLEQRLDIALFDRGPQGTELTAAGRYLVPYAEQITTTWQQVHGDLKHRYSDRVALRLGAQLSIWEQLLVDWMIWLETHYGKLPLTMDFDYHTDMNEAVKRRLVDLAITHQATSQRQLCCHQMPDETLILVSSRAACFGQGPMPKYVDFNFGEDYYQQLQGILPEVNRRHQFLGNSAMGLRYLINGGGMSYYPERLAAAFIETGELHRVSEAPAIELGCYLVYHRDTAHQDLIDLTIEGFFTQHLGKGRSLK